MIKEKIAPEAPTTPLEAAYDAEAIRYDSERYVKGEGRFFDHLEAAVLADLLEPVHGTRILDVPTGTGRSALPLARLGALVTGVDISSGMLAQAQQKAAAEGLTAIEFRKASVFELPFADGSFDVVSSFKFFHLLSEEKKLSAIGEMRRVLRPGGTFVAEFNSPFYGLGLAFIRYYFQKKHPGGMRQKCLFPDQLRTYFAGFEVTAIVGVKLPFAGALSRLTGEQAMIRVNRIVGRIPVVRQFCYAIIVVATKPLPHRT